MRVSAASSSRTGDAQGVSQAVTRADVKLAVGVSEMGLDGLGGDEQGLGNLGIAQALGGELGGPAFRGGEGVSAAMGRAPRPGAGGVQLVTRVGLEHGGAHLVGQLQGFAQWRPGGRDLAGTALSCAEVKEGVAVGKHRGAGPEHADGVSEEFVAVVVWSGRCQGAQRHTRGARGSRPLGTFQPGPRERLGASGVAERVCSERRGPSPRDETGMVDTEALFELPAGSQCVAERLLGSSVGECQTSTRELDD
jgi:hypothetical protein